MPASVQGEVYRASDTKLGREVAIKVLPEEFSRVQERLDRFQREAKLLAALSSSARALPPDNRGCCSKDRTTWLRTDLAEVLASRLQ